MHQRKIKNRTLIYCMNPDNQHANTCTARCSGTMRGREVVPSFEIGVGSSKATRRCCHGVPRESCHGIRKHRDLLASVSFGSDLLPQRPLLPRRPS
jgi:hypothetical protein